MAVQGQPPVPHFGILDHAPMGPRQYAIWLLASGGTLLDGFSIFSLGVAMPLLTSRFDLGPLMVGLIGSALVLGAAIGAAFGGAAADRFGRKPLLIIDMAILATGAVFSGAAENALAVLFGQFLIGVGIGIDFPVSASYVSETMPKRARSRMMVATIALQSVGMLMAAAIALPLLQLHGSAIDWRFIVGATGAGAFAFMLARMWLPESPRWLLEHGHPDKAAHVVTGLARVAIDRPMSAPPSAERGMSVLFSRPYRVRTALVSVPWFLMDIATYGVGLFTPVILAALHLGAKAHDPVAADFAAAQGSATIDLFLLFGFLIGLWAVPRFGRLHMQVVGFAGMTLGMLILLAAVLSSGSASPHIALIFLGFVLFNLAMNAGPNATTFTLAPELFPTAVRASASGFAAAAAKTGATLGIFLLPQVKEFWGVAGVLFLMAIVSTLGAAITLILGKIIRDIPEGRGLEEVSQPIVASQGRHAG
ncbi:MFS transporter [Pseudorhodoplanes sp.]|uniref:MFS transporter n=1 Tax=Pseudorhodoplanes sp. TaxID=1934341 RepID=UPI003D106906